MFILEWLTEYMTTPKMEMTTEVEMLGILAIGIIALVIIGVSFAVWGIGSVMTETWNKKKHKRHRRGKNNNEDKK